MPVHRSEGGINERFIHANNRGGTLALLVICTAAPFSWAGIDDGEYDGDLVLRDEDSLLARPVCEAGQRFNITDTSRRMRIVESFALINRRNVPATMTVESHESGTSRFTVGTSVSASASAAIFAEIKVEVNAQVSKEVTATVGFGGSTSVGANSTVLADYGVQKEKVYGKSYRLTQDCYKREVVTTPASAPWRKAWRFKDQ